MSILIGNIVAFFALPAAAALRASNSFRNERRPGRRVPGDTGVSPISPADDARYDTWLCVRE
jgi:hypothetical protein